MLQHPLLSCCVLVAVVGIVVGPPPRKPPPVEAGDANKELKSEENSEENDPMEDIAKLEYDRYLKEVVNTLETDEMFRKKLEEASADEIKTGDIAQHLEFVSHGVRSQLDELKRREMDRVRQLLRLKMQQAQNNVGKGGLLGPAGNLAAGMKILESQKMLAHLDHSNSESFGVEDLSKLIKQASKDLDDIDKKRREEFKQYEMEREHLRREKMKQMDDRKRAEEQAAWEEKMKTRKNHPKLNHPGGRDQLEEVWEKGDGYDKEDFNPKTFFFLHDTNNNGVLEHAEVEALFLKELEKLYKEDDSSQESKIKRFEEMNRMREHVVNEVDKDGDGLISLDEFMESTRGEEFENSDEDWEDIDDNDIFSDEEMMDFERAYEERQRQQAFNGHAQPGEVNIPRMPEAGRLNVPPNVNDINQMNIPKQQVMEQQLRDEQMRQAAQQAQADQVPQQGQPVQDEALNHQDQPAQDQPGQQDEVIQGQQVQQGEPIQQGQPVQEENQPVQQDKPVQQENEPLQPEDTQNENAGQNV